MKLDIFLNKAANTKAQNRLLKLIVMVIGATVLVNTYLLHKYINSRRTVLIPPAMNSRVEILGDKASDEYIKEFTRYTLALILNYTPATARGQFDEALALYAPQVYQKVSKMLYDLADTIEITHTSNVFYISGISVNSDRSLIEVKGLNTRFVQDRHSKSERKTYLIQYKIENGRFMILELSEKTR